MKGYVFVEGVRIKRIFAILEFPIDILRVYNKEDSVSQDSFIITVQIFSILESYIIIIRIFAILEFIIYILRAYYKYTVAQESFIIIINISKSLDYFMQPPAAVCSTGYARC